MRKKAKKEESNHDLRRKLTILGQQKASLIRKGKDPSDIERAMERTRAKLDSMRAVSYVNDSESWTGKSSKYVNYSNNNANHPFSGGTVSPK